MAILMWDKPPRVMSKDAWKGITADGATPGTYVPNMSDADREAWKAKLVGITKDNPRVEIRKTTVGTQVLIIVGLTDLEQNDRWNRYKGKRIKISQNGPAYWEEDEIHTLHGAINEARKVLLKLEQMKRAGLNPRTQKQVLEYMVDEAES